jgi:hypothetical protein
VQESLADPDSVLLTYGSIAVFVIGFLTAFAIYRLIGRSIPRAVPTFMIWPVSIGVGIANLALFFFLVSFQLR